jgi:neutral amino acid transport system permease protein
MKGGLVTSMRRVGTVLLLALFGFLAVGQAAYADGHISLTGSMSGPEGVPFEGVSFTITGPGDLSVEVRTNAEGEWSLPIDRTGQYYIEIDPESLPEEVVLTNPNQVRKTVIVFSLERQPGTLTFATGIGEPPTPKWRIAVQLTADGILLGLMLSLAAVGLSLIFGTTGLTNFAHGELLTLGAMGTIFFNKTIGLAVIPSIILAVITAGILGGFLQNRFLWQPLRRRGTGLIAMLVVSIGFGLFIRYIFLYFFGGQTQQFRQYSGQAGLSLGPVTATPKALITGVIAIILLVLASLWLLKTRNGKASRAIADNPALASASGIEVEKVIMLVWVGGAVLAAFAGVMMGLNQGVNFLMGSDILLLIFAAVTLGGLGTAFGAILGAMVVGLFIQLSTLFIPTELKYVGALLLLILILLVRPQGILGKRERIG